MQTEVRFRSTAFNCSESRDYYINHCCFGDDIARWLIRELQALGIKTADKPDQEDFGWYVTFTVEGIDHRFMIGFQPNDPAAGDQWVGSVERASPFVDFILKGKNRKVANEAIRMIDTVLRLSPDIHDISWHVPFSIS